ncbi:chemotaxis protein CheW [Deltaproteobacteria bacterium OttesenSCG-928-K17]|nr:chemotaxis protein CheW [Deltaproteobacteria bacterium OttesenSCG-928-K17]
MTDSAPQTETKAAVKADPFQQENEGKYLTFQLAEEGYGIGILKVREIIGMLPVTPVPQTPGFLKGVINLRGQVIPVVDLRLKFGLMEEQYTERTSIIVVEVKGLTGNIPIGIVVDTVSEVINIQAGEIEPAPAFGVSIDTAFILGMAKTDGGVKILLNIDQVLSAEELGAI